MTDFRKLFAEAETTGLLKKGQSEKLTSFFIEKGVIEKPANTPNSTAYFAELDENKNDERDSNSESSEMPRLIRGFHDVLITIGVVVVLSALTALTNVIVVLIAVWALAEFFVKKQNLAFPAFALSVAFMGGAWFLSFILVDNVMGSDLSNEGGFAAVAVMILLVSLLISVFYWRFRVPVTLACLILSASTVVYFFVLYIAAEILGLGAGDKAMFSLFGRVLAVLSAVLLFIASMKLDSTDRLRKTRRSDVAFWLNLIIAPVLLYSLLSLVFLSSTGFNDNDFGATQAFIVLIFIAVMMLIGVVIDRRAFVTAGLISLGGAVFVLVKNLDLGYSSFFSTSALIVGVIVLTIGVGWEFLRKKIVPNLPDFIQENVPPVEIAQKTTD